MKIEVENIFLEKGNQAEEWFFFHARQDIKDAILKAVWPIGAKNFTINPHRKGNGVKPIKDGFIKYLKDKDWITEERFNLVDGFKAGPLDGLKKTEIGDIAVEWETGNISSSHRALNKLALALINKQIIGGFLIVPTFSLYRFLTDRVGNYRELEPYFPLYRNLNIKKGTLGIYGVTFDDISKDVPLIPKGSDGNSIKSKRN